MQQTEFPKTLAPKMRFFDRRWIAGALTKTLILPLRSDGKQTTQDDREARLGVYTWNRDKWQLEGVYNSQREARSAANRARKVLN